MKKLSRRIALVLAALFIVPAVVAPASATPLDVIHCEWKGKVVLSEGLKLVVPGGQSGTTTFFGNVVCSGSLDGTSFSNAAGSSTGTGTFGDGPISRAYGGATCSHNDG